jgi:hypothetical protein
VAAFSFKVLSNGEKISAKGEIIKPNGEKISANKEINELNGENNPQTVKTLFSPSQERLMDPDAGLHAVPHRNRHLF